MTNDTSENKRSRDYSYEYQIRQKRNKRLHADMDREKAEAFQKYLDSKNLTFIKWLNNQIDIEMNKA